MAQEQYVSASPLSCVDAFSPLALFVFSPSIAWNQGRMGNESNGQGPERAREKTLKTGGPGDKLRENDEAFRKWLERKRKQAQSERQAREQSEAAFEKRRCVLTLVRRGSDLDDDTTRSGRRSPRACRSYLHTLNNTAKSYESRSIRMYTPPKTRADTGLRLECQLCSPFAVPPPRSI